MRSSENGQVLAATAILTVALVACVVWVAEMGNLYRQRARMQMAADAGVTAGSAIIADTLNELAVMNYLLLAAHGASVVAAFTTGTNLDEVVRVLEKSQTVLASKTHTAEIVGAMLKATLNEGATHALPMNRLPSGKYDNPILGVEIKKINPGVLAAILGGDGTYAVTSMSPDAKAIYGSRFLQVYATTGTTKGTEAATNLPVLPIETPTIMAAAQAGVQGGRLWFSEGGTLGLPNPGYRAEVVPCTFAGDKIWLH